MIRKIFIFNRRLTEILEIGEEKITIRLKNVLRLKPKDKVSFLNNYEEEAIYEVLDNKKWILRRVDYKIRQLKPKRKINLYCSLIRKENFELIIEKGTELGVHGFYPLITERSSLKIDKIPERWNQIIATALEVTNWKHTPQIHKPIKLKEILDRKNLHSFYTAEKSGNLINSFKLEEEINLIVGPEGGFSEKELLELKRKTKLLSLGDINFRTETSVIIFLSLLNFS